MQPPVAFGDCAFDETDALTNLTDLAAPSRGVCCGPATVEAQLVTLGASASASASASA